MDKKLAALVVRIKELLLNELLLKAVEIQEIETIKFGITITTEGGVSISDALELLFSYTEDSDDDVEYEEMPDSNREDSDDGDEDKETQDSENTVLENRNLVLTEYDNNLLQTYRIKTDKE